MRFFLLLLILIIVSCKAKPVITEAPVEKLLTEQFLENPFGHPSTVNAFKEEQSAKFKVQQAEIQNKYYENLTDTIYRLSYKNSVINIVRSRGKERLSMADIQDKEIVLQGNIVVGMAKEAVINRFYHFPKFSKNIVTVYSKDQNNRCTFVFKDEILHRIRCERVLQ